MGKNKSQCRKTIKDPDRAGSLICSRRSTHTGPHRDGARLICWSDTDGEVIYWKAES